MTVTHEAGSSLHLQASFLLSPPLFRMALGREMGSSGVVSLDTSEINPLISHNKTNILIPPHPIATVTGCLSLFSSGPRFFLIVPWAEGLRIRFPVRLWGDPLLGHV